MGEIVALIGFGEAGQSIGRGLAGEPGVGVAAYDVRFCGEDARALTAKTREAGVAPHAELSRALKGADAIERHTRFPSPLAGEGGELRAQSERRDG